jgi:hypothetical protein
MPQAQEPTQEITKDSKKKGAVHKKLHRISKKKRRC